MLVATSRVGVSLCAQHLENHCGTIVYFSLDFLAAALCGLPYAAFGAPINYGSFIRALRSTTTTSLKIRPRAIPSRCLARRPSPATQWTSIRRVSMRRLQEPAAATTPAGGLPLRFDAHRRPRDQQHHV